MESSTLKEEVLKVILDRPGTARSELSRVFGLSSYRLKRIFRHIGRDLTGRKLVNSEKRGVWIVRVDPCGCLGMTWIGEANGGFVQCTAQPEFEDGRCFEHSQCENPSMVAFMRRLVFLAGPCAPSAGGLCQTSITIVEDLEAELASINPWTRKDQLNKAELLEMLASAKRFLYWKRRLHSGESPWIPQELLGRHRASSINPFEFSLKKHFVTLGISPDATKEEVVKAWKRLARRYHPDLGKGDEERMKAINLAKERIFIIRRWDR